MSDISVNWLSDISVNWGQLLTEAPVADVAPEGMAWHLINSVSQQCEGTSADGMDATLITSDCSCQPQGLVHSNFVTIVCTDIILQGGVCASASSDWCLNRQYMQQLVFGLCKEL